MRLTTAPAPNVPPTAAFSVSTSDLTTSFTDTSTDSDGTITSWSWTFGDGNSSTAVNPTYSYIAAGTYNVTVTVSSLPPAAPTNLTASIQSTGKGKNKVVTSVQLNWSDNSNNEDVFVIERCEETGKGRSRTCNFVEFVTLGADITSFSFSPDSSKYQYRVKARNAQGDSAYTNKVKI